jgi:hypothetical protein
MAIQSGISKRFTISDTKLKIKLNESLNSAMISEGRVSKKILNVFFLRQINAISKVENQDLHHVALTPTHKSVQMGFPLHSTLYRAAIIDMALLKVCHFPLDYFRCKTSLANNRSMSDESTQISR